MTVYVVRKYQGQWSVCANDGSLVTFDSYGEAIETARLAAAVIRKTRKQIGRRKALDAAAYVSTTTYFPSTLTGNVSALYGPSTSLAPCSTETS